MALDDGVCVAFWDRQTNVYSLSETYDAHKIIKGKSFQILEKQISKLQDEVLNIEVSTIKAIYGIKIDKDNYKKYKLG